MSQNGQHIIIRSIPRFRQLPRPVVARVESLLPGSLTPWHDHDWWQLSWAYSGLVELQTRAGSFMAPPSRAIWIPPHTEHQAANVAHTEMRSLYVASALMSWAPPRCRVVTMSPLVRELIVRFSTLPADYASEGPNGRLIAVLVDELSALEEVAFDLPMPADARLLRVCHALQAAPDDARTLAAWAALAGLSERSLTRLFMEQTGMSFGDWRQRLRLLLSLTALGRGERVTRVALDAGYASPSAFIAAFRRSFGMTPTEMFA
ncbi:MAG: helix-turn-helix transcriptional regulator [Candidatus Dactylopiibacterium sp.]|nr:helix-turn-helix transcriptional regulator [Candidatus Dactylopiibacterium sp.]